jgi:hypothetical protein
MFQNEKLPTIENPTTEREIVYDNMEKLIRRAKYEYEFGGVEDDDGALLLGEIDFTNLRSDIDQAISVLDEETKGEVTLLIDFLENKYATNELSLETITEVLHSVRACILDKTKMSEETLALYTELHSFIDRQILTSDGGERRAWGIALLNFRHNKDHEGLVSLLKTLSETTNEDTQEQVKKFLHLLSRK